MVGLRTILIFVTAVVFLAIGLVIVSRQKEARGMLRSAKICITLAAFSVSAAFLVEVISALSYEFVHNDLLVKQLYVFNNLFAMLALAFLSSFSVLATYGGRRRNLIAAIFVVMALIPPVYLSFTYSQATVKTIPEQPEPVFTAPPYADIFYAIFGGPLFIVPVALFTKSYIAARKRGDSVLGQRAAMMLSALLLNEVTYIVYVFGTGIVELAALITWIPIALFLLFAFLKITSIVKPKT